MKTSRANALAASALLGVVLFAFQGCSSDATQSDAVDANTGGSGSGGSSNTSSETADSDATSTSSTTGAAGAGSDCEDPTQWWCNPDPNCTSSGAKTDMACSIDCQIGCGFDQLGTKVCSCQGGVYSQCPCPRPAAYKGADLAKLCNDPEFPSATETGLMEEMKGNPCTTEWEECIATDIPPGTTPRGCVCMMNLVTEQLQWYCGSTNKWFALE